MDELSSITDDIFLVSRSHSNSTSSHDYEMMASDGLAAAYGVLAVVALVRDTSRDSCIATKDSCCLYALFFLYIRKGKKKRVTAVLLFLYEN